jgi:ATP-binding cassette subfamily B protein
MIAALWATLATRPSMALYFVVAVPVSVVLINSFQQSVRERQTVFRRDVENMSAQVSEMVDRIPTARAHGLETWEINSMQGHLEKIRIAGQRLDFTSELFASSSWVSFQVSQFCCLLYSSWLVYRGEITIGQAMMYHGYFGMLVGSVGGILAIWPIFVTGAEAMRSIGEVLEASDVEVNVGKKPVASVDGHFFFDNVSFQYPRQEEFAVQNFQIVVPPGDCIAVVGPSGSGKSTLMNLVIGFLKPAKGRILLDGCDMADLNLREYRHFIAVVPQVTVLFSGTLRDNIVYGLENVDEEALRRCVTMANLDEVIAHMPKGLETTVGERGATLSGGQRQRVAIARAMLRNPRVLILDEATSALDVFSEKVVQDALTRLLKGRTTFIVAHRLSTIRHANRIMVVDHGRLIESGSHESLMALNGMYTRMHDLNEL